ncbi:DUF1877 family protein [Corallococcus aberystwythensis]|uniref:DUF1877 family protein n=1 Tax=Corallococcus aberystwythensis TaxID=2316722 RepID=A0A3A8R0I5_9BACT|nr:DUF1877 family protein [Corallococcus aberystwythensis]RKH74549.1 DUF1877 family protein [Corallococcus aberystwythensis]
MGLDARYQALPGGSLLLELARRNAGVGGWLSSITWMLQDPRKESLAPGGPDPGELLLLGAVRDALKTRPDLATHQVDLQRRWDHLHFVLSAHRRDAPGTEDDSLAGIAINGEERIGPHVVATQGVPLRYTWPETVERIARMLESFPFDSHREHFTFERLSQAGVYKCPREKNVEEDWQWLRERFDLFRAFYVTAAKHGDGVLVCVD